MIISTRRVRLSTLAKFTGMLVFATMPLILAAQVTSVVKVISTPNPVVQGQVVKFTAGVNWTADVSPTGTIVISDTCLGTNGAAVTKVLGAVTLGAAISPAPGAGILSASLFPCFGANEIIGAYSGDANYSTGKSQPLLQDVLNKFTPVSVNLVSSPNPAIEGQTVSLVAQFSFAVAANTRATGTVTFKNINTGAVLGTASVQTSGGGRTLFTNASIATAALAPGSYAIQADYSGDNIYSPATSQILYEVVHGPKIEATTTALTTSASQITVGQSVKFSAQVRSATATPSGAISFFDGPTLLARLNLDSLGDATLTTGSLRVGSHLITAAYSGDSSFAASTSPIESVVVHPVPLALTTTALASSSDPVKAGTLFTLAAEISSSSAGTPTGRITFLNETLASPTVLAVVTLQNGTASLNLSFGTAGTYKLSASYSGDTNFAPSAGTLLEVVTVPTLPATRTLISSSANPSTYGQTVTFFANVSGSAGIPTGSIIFNVGASTAEVSLDSAGKATYTTAALPAESVSVTAAYLGDLRNAGSNSPALIQTINKAETILSTVSSKNPSAHGSPIILKVIVAVTAPGTGTPAGTVSFTADNSNILCASATVQSDRSATCTTSLLAVGSHQIVVDYSGNLDFYSSSGSFTQTVNSAVKPIQVQVRGTGFVYNRVTKLFTTTLTATSTNAQTVSGPIQIVFTNLTPGVTVVNASGTYNGSPYITINGTLAPGGSLSLPVQFADPSLGSITFVPLFYSGVF